MNKEENTDLSEIYQRTLSLTTNVVYAAGVWDLFHVGHLNLIKRAASVGDFLIIGVSSDELVFKYKNRKPVIPLKERFKIISSLCYPDFVVVQENQFHLPTMRTLGVDTVVMGNDWENSDKPELLELKKEFDVVFLSRTDGVSSTDIKKRFKNNK